MCAPVLGVFDSDPNPDVMASSVSVAPLVAFRPWNITSFCSSVTSSKNIVKTLYLNGFGCRSGNVVYASFSGVDDSDAKYTARWLALLGYNEDIPCSTCYTIFSKVALPAPVVKTSNTTVRYVYRVGFPIG